MIEDDNRKRRAGNCNWRIPPRIRKDHALVGAEGVGLSRFAVTGEAVMRWLRRIPKLDQQFSRRTTSGRCILNASRVFEVKERRTDRIGTRRFRQVKHRQQKRKQDTHRCEQHCWPGCDFLKSHLIQAARHKIPVAAYAGIICQCAPSIVACAIAASRAKAANRRAVRGQRPMSRQIAAPAIRETRIISRVRIA